MSYQLAFVFGGGGARGAMEVGAVRALLEAGYHPDLLVGTSIGAMNATFLALNGLTLEGITKLEKAWHSAASANLLPSNYIWLTMRSIFNRRVGTPSNKLRNFLILQGLLPELTFGDIRGVKLLTVATDLNNYRLTVFGQNPNDSLLEGVLASASIPPWVEPMQRNDQYLIDGGVVSNLPIEPAIAHGATEIIALDLSDPRAFPGDSGGYGPFLVKMLITLTSRQVELEKAIAVQKGVPVHQILMRPEIPVPLWDFQRTDELISTGYELTKQAMHGSQSEKAEILPWWRRWLPGPKNRSPQA